VGATGPAIRRGGVTTADGGQPELSAFQLEVARLFFALPASKGFLLAGGAALLAQHLTARPTEDLDFFTAAERGHVPAARDALEAVARQRGWTTERIHDSDTFCRLVIHAALARPDVGEDLRVGGPASGSGASCRFDRGRRSFEGAEAQGSDLLACAWWNWTLPGRRGRERVPVLRVPRG
jgi:hypothetical protein